MPRPDGRRKCANPHSNKPEEFIRFKSRQEKYRTINPKGFLNRAYQLMCKRIREYPTYKGLEICTRQEFYARFLTCPRFLYLHKQWLLSAKKASRKWPHKILRPTPDRIESILGYEIENIQWMTYSENCAKPGKRKRDDCEEAHDDIPF